jgi:ArsR family transcriptional regulator
MKINLILKALSDRTRFKIVELLLKRNYCVRALSRKIGISESAVSQHIKLLREAGLLSGKKRGYFMHYEVNRELLHELSKGIEQLAEMEQEECTPAEGKCTSSEHSKCHYGKCRRDGGL